MLHAIIYSTENCPYCQLAKQLLTSRHIPFDEIRIDLDDAKREEMMRITGRRTVPQIFINDQHIGGYDDLTLFIKSGKLETLINK